MQSQDVDPLPAAATEGHPGSALQKILYAGAALPVAVLLLVYYGKLAGDLVALSSGQADKSPLKWVLLAMGLVATLSVTAVITQKARKGLGRKVEVNRG